MRIGIVTDSTANQPLEFFDLYDDTVMVPLTVHFGTETFKDWLEMPADDFYAKLANAAETDPLPTTSQPSVGDFVAAYRGLAKAGVGHIVSIHVSEKMSGTIKSAQMALELFNEVPVTIIDSLHTSGTLGAMVKMMLEARDSGASLAEILAIAEYGREWGIWLFVLSTLKYLETGGRGGDVGSDAPVVKPVLMIKDGAVAAAAKANGTKQAIKEMIRLISEQIEARPAGHPVRLIIGYTDDKSTLDVLLAMVEEAGLRYDYLEVCQAGAVVGSHAGPGCIMLGAL
jgi:DegV family protein with EDD domain